VVESLKQFRNVAIEYGVANEWIGRVEAAIVNHLKAWGKWENTSVSEITIHGHIIADFHIEQQFKGNYLLQATIDGRPLKYIVRKGTPEHDTLTKTGLSNLMEEMMKELTERYLLPKI
jgi:serine/threonine-protein kinase HipA